MHSQEQTFGGAVQLPFGTLTSHIGAPGFQPQLLAITHAGRQQAMAHAVGFLSSMRETQMDFLAPGAAMAIGSIRGVNHHMGDLSLPFKLIN